MLKDVTNEELEKYLKDAQEDEKVCYVAQVMGINSFPQDDGWPVEDRQKMNRAIIERCTKELAERKLDNTKAKQDTANRIADQLKSGKGMYSEDMIYFD
jgi:hypothetical protein